MNLMTLPVQRPYNGYTLRQVKRVNNWAIYDMGDNTHFEVVRIRVRDVSTMGGGGANFQREGYTHIEVYPSSEEWGKRGYTCTSLEAATKKLEEKTKKCGKHYNLK
jgi:hypothetical protein